jgi:ethanolamine utilization microcompartment shell protein EutS
LSGCCNWGSVDICELAYQRTCQCYFWGNQYVAEIIPALTATNVIDKTDALGVVETFDIVSTILAADASAKAADITLCEIRIAMAIGGKAFYTMTGSVAAVEAAVEAGLESLREKGLVVHSVVIPRPRPELFREFI